MKRIYFATVDGGIVDNYDIEKAWFITCGKHPKFCDDNFDNIREYARTCKGIKKELENPSIRYLLKKGIKWRAVQVWRERHPELSLSEAKEAVEKFENKIEAEEAEAKEGKS